MTLKQYLIIMSVGAFFCWLAWFFIIGSVDPKEAGIVGFLFFYLSLFLALAGTCAIIGFLIRKKITKDDEVVFRHVKRTFRQGIFISFAVIVGLLLLQAKLLAWWNAILLVILFFVLEGIIFTNRKYNNKDFSV